jgi:hypothetical protein
MKILNLLRTKKNWVKHKLAVDSRNRNVAYDDPKAVAWCLLGAGRRCYGGSRDESDTKLENAIATLFPQFVYGFDKKGDIIAFNNHKDTTFADLRRVVKLAGL